MPTPYVGARSIEELAAALQKFDYTPRTEAERRTQAENLYRQQLEQALLSAQQQYETSDTALRNQLTGLDTAANRQIEAQRENTARAISEADRRALQRGMQRSTYNNATLANLQLKGNKAEAEIQENRTNAEQNIESQRALLAQQLAQNQSAANSQFQNSVIAQMQQYEDQDYERKLNADSNNNTTQLQLYEAQQQDAQQAEAARQFNATYAQNQYGLEMQALGHAQDQQQMEMNWALQQAQLAENQRQFDATMAFNREKAAAAGGSGGNTSNNGTPTSGLNGGLTPEQIAAMNAAAARDYSAGATGAVYTKPEVNAPYAANPNVGRPAATSTVNVNTNKNAITPVGNSSNNNSVKKKPKINTNGITAVK